MSDSKVLKFIHGGKSFTEIRAFGGPSVEQAFMASQELIRLQQIFPMLRTHEEKQNNLRQSEQCLEAMHQYILANYLRTDGPQSVS